MENKNIWQILSKIDCSQKIERKNGLNYLSWVWAWGIVKENFNDANYEVVYFNEKPYLFDENLGYMVKTNVTIQNETIQMHLPVIDGANKSYKNVKYTYEVAKWENGKKNGTIEKTVESASMFDINTTIMRCLTKNLAMFGLGHYIYAGEDFPSEIPNVENKEKDKNKAQEFLKEKLIELENVDSFESLLDIQTKHKELLVEKSFSELFYKKLQSIIKTTEKVLDLAKNKDELKVAFLSLHKGLQKYMAKYTEELKLKLTPKQ